MVAAARDIILVIFPYEHMSSPERETHSREHRGGVSHAAHDAGDARRLPAIQPRPGIWKRYFVLAERLALADGSTWGCDHQRNSSARKPLTEFEGLEQSVLLLAHKSGLHKVGDSIRLFPCGGSAVLGIRQASTRRQRGTGMRYTHRAARDTGRTSLGHRSVRGRVLDRATGRGHAGAVQRCLRERYNGALGYLNRAP